MNNFLYFLTFLCRLLAFCDLSSLLTCIYINFSKNFVKAEARRTSDDSDAAAGRRSAVFFSNFSPLLWLLCSPFVSRA